MFAKAHLRKISPRGGYRRTRHHWGWCTSCRKYSPAPSTSQAGTSVCAGKISITLAKLWSIINLFLGCMYADLRCLWRHSCCHAWCLSPVQSHRSSLSCPERGGHSWLRGPDAHTAQRQEGRRQVISSPLHSTYLFSIPIQHSTVNSQSYSVYLFL